MNCWLVIFVFLIDWIFGMEFTFNLENKFDINLTVTLYSVNCWWVIFFSLWLIFWCDARNCEYQVKLTCWQWLYIAWTAGESFFYYCSHFYAAIFFISHCETQFEFGPSKGPWIILKWSLKQWLWLWWHLYSVAL